MWIIIETENALDISIFTRRWLSPFSTKNIYQI